MGDAVAHSNSEQPFRLRSIFLILSFTAWLASLALPALITPRHEYTGWGYGILGMGWLGIAGVADDLSRLGVFAWWANPFYLWAVARALAGKTPVFSTSMAVALGTLTVLVSNYAVGSGATFAPVIGYGPGALLWYLAILTLALVVARDAGSAFTAKVIACAVAVVAVAYTAQVLWRFIGANEAERQRLPFYAAKRGPICSATMSPLPIPEQQRAIGLEAPGMEWLESLRQWDVVAIQRGSIEFRRAPEGSPESKRVPFMTAEAVTTPARYTLRVQGGHPYINEASDGGDFVRLQVIDNRTNAIIGELAHHREWNRRLGFCPSLTWYRRGSNEEAIRWLAPFIQPR
jgi:hypothetical protein